MSLRPPSGETPPTPGVPGAAPRPAALLIDPPEGALDLFVQIAPGFVGVEEAARVVAPELPPDQLRDLALRRSLARLGRDVSRETFAYLRWRLERAFADIATTRAESEALRARTSATRAEVRAARDAVGLAPRPPLRHFRDADLCQWSVHEVSMAHVEWARGPRCLLFSAEGTVRRVWRYPAEWWRLPDSELEALSWTH